MTTYESALKYASKGFHVVPVAKGGKRPILPNWVEDCSKDPETIKDWFKDKDLNIGIVTGKQSGIIVIDIDTHGDKDGRKSIAAMESKLESYLPTTVTARTQSGGIHLFFTYPSGVDRIVGKIGLLDNVDIRADGNQVVVYPSKGEVGSYDWIISPMQSTIASLPKAWKNFICGITEANQIKIPRRPFRLPDSVPSGMRHATLLSYACSLGAKGMSPTEVSGAVREANKTVCHPPISDEVELENIITWAIEKVESGETRATSDGLPQWVAEDKNGKRRVDEPSFVQWYKNEYALVCINGIFYDTETQLDSLMIKRDIQNLISPYTETSLAGKVNALFDALKNECYMEPPVPEDTVINLSNASLKVTPDGIYEIEPPFTLNRLNVEYKPNTKTPIWDDFLSTLLYEDDIKTLQEYIGYSLLPTTVAQKALFLIGRGGEGKSIVGEVVHAMFGKSMVQGELHKLQENRFMLAQLENKLLFYDDDLQTGALADTGIFKKLVTATIPVLVERKGEPHYEILPYARIMASGNEPLKACYDKSDGFFRRIIILECKDKPKGRKDDRTLGRRIVERELSGVLDWALEGLQRLVSNNWEFTVSERSEEAIRQSIEDANNIITYLSTSQSIEYGETQAVSSGDLYRDYERWCEDNAFKPLAMRTFSTWLHSNGGEYEIQYSSNVGGKRGFKGVGVISPPPVAGKFKIVKGGL